MAFTHGSKAVLKVADSGGTDRDISTYLKSTGVNNTNDSADVTALTNTAKAYIAGLKDGTIPLEGVFDPTADGYLSGILGVNVTPRAFTYYPAGTATGSPTYSGSAILTSYNISTGVDGAAMFSGELQVTGGATRGTVA